MVLEFLLLLGGPGPGPGPLGACFRLYTADLYGSLYEFI